MAKYKILKTKQQKFFYREFGKSDLPTLICLHGYADSARLFDELAEDINEDFHLLALDFPSARNEKQFSIESLTDYLNQFVSLKKIDHISLLGFSFGGFVAINYADKYQDKVKNLFLLSSFPKLLTNLPTKLILMIITFFTKRSHLLCKLLAFFQTSKLVRRLFDLETKTDQELKFIKRHAYSIYSTVTEVISHKLVKQFNKLTIDKTLVLFKDDKVFKFDRYYPFINNLDCKVVAFNHGGHDTNQAYWNNVKSVLV